MSIIITVLLICISINAHADTKVGKDNVVPVYAALEAILVASDKYGVDAGDLVRIAYVESRLKVQPKPRVNHNGTVDIGMFQINSVHWSTTCKGLDVLKVEGNAMCAAKLLSEAKAYKGIDKHWKGRYHSKTPALKRQYSSMLAKVAIR